MNTQSIFNKKRFAIILGLSLALLALSGTWALAQSDGVIYACVLNDGTLRIVPDADQCKKNETLYSWNIMGPQGNPGLACWDLNGDGLADPEEDLNLDGLWDAADCKGPQGEQGPQGPPGEPATPDPKANPAGLLGPKRDGVADPEEDLNLDGLWDAVDCQGPQGLQGSQNPSGSVATRQLVPAANSLTTLDSAGIVGMQTSITVGAVGLPVISYHDYFNSDLKVAHCSDFTCSSASLDSAVNIVSNHNHRRGDGLPVISYYDASRDLKVALRRPHLPSATRPP
jgi:hypothetical protein